MGSRPNLRFRVSADTALFSSLKRTRTTIYFKLRHTGNEVCTKHENERGLKLELIDHCDSETPFRLSTYIRFRLKNLLNLRSGAIK